MPVNIAELEQESAELLPDRQALGCWNGWSGYGSSYGSFHLSLNLAGQFGNQFGYGSW